MFVFNDRFNETTPTSVWDDFEFTTPVDGILDVDMSNGNQYPVIVTTAIVISLCFVITGAVIGYYSKKRRQYEKEWNNKCQKITLLVE